MDTQDSLESIPLILQLSRAAGKELTLDLYASMLSVTYYPASIICQSNQTADRFLYDTVRDVCINYLSTCVPSWIHD
jgi:hypothetical protein